MALEDGTVLSDGENELNGLPTPTGTPTMPADLEMPDGSGRESSPMGAGDNPMGDATTAGGDPDDTDAGDEQEPDGTDGTEGGGV